MNVWYKDIYLGSFPENCNSMKLNISLLTSWYFVDSKLFTWSSNRGSKMNIWIQIRCWTVQTMSPNPIFWYLDKIPNQFVTNWILSFKNFFQKSDAKICNIQLYATISQFYIVETTSVLTCKKWSMLSNTICIDKWF